MALSELTDYGELPLGVHPASLQETLEQFGTGHPQRITVGERLERVHSVAVATGQLARFVVYGSFVTDKPVSSQVPALHLVDFYEEGA